MPYDTLNPLNGLSSSVNNWKWIATSWVVASCIAARRALTATAGSDLGLNERTECRLNIKSLISINSTSFYLSAKRFLRSME